MLISFPGARRSGPARTLGRPLASARPIVKSLAPDQGPQPRSAADIAARTGESVAAARTAFAVLPPPNGRVRFYLLRQ
jgi:hypothetical protein